jgi:hypothetical protein
MLDRKLGSQAVINFGLSSYRSYEAVHPVAFVGLLFSDADYLMPPDLVHAPDELDASDTEAPPPFKDPLP